jgi:hypothetical protein
MSKLPAGLLEATADVGIYPASVQEGNVVTLRTEWQNGWNAALMAITEQWVRANAWWKTLTPSQQARLTALFDDDVLSVHIPEGGPVELGVICNDVFAWGFADLEPLTLDEVSQLHVFWVRDPKWGPTQWCIWHRDQPPQKAVERDMRADGAYPFPEE